MEIKIEKGIAKGVVKAPPSKSYAHRYLIAGALSGNCQISNISFSDDILATFNCLKSLGYKLEKEGNVVTCKGRGSSTRILDCGESGSTLRFMIPLCLLDDEMVTLKGTKKLFSRGLDIYLDIFKEQGIMYDLTEDSITLKGKLKPNKHFAFPGDVSSQFISGLLFVLPLLDGFSKIELTTKLESASYVDMTLSTLRRFGLTPERIGRNIYILGNEHYSPKQEMVVEGDYSNAAFLDAFNLLGGEVKVTGLNKRYSRQGDRAYPEYFASIKKGCPTIDLSNNIDLGPILFTLCTLFHGAVFKGIKRLRIKESDRVNDMLVPLKEYGVKYELKEDEIHIYPIEKFESDKHLHPVNDHRIVMSLIVLLTTCGGYIDNIEAINKSYPNFLDDIESLGIGVKYGN